MLTRHFGTVCLVASDQKNRPSGRFFLGLWLKSNDYLSGCWPVALFGEKICVQVDGGTSGRINCLGAEPKPTNP